MLPDAPSTQYHTLDENSAVSPQLRRSQLQRRLTWIGFGVGLAIASVALIAVLALSPKAAPGARPADLSLELQHSARLRQLSLGSGPTPAPPIPIPDIPPNPLGVKANLTSQVCPVACTHGHVRARMRLLCADTDASPHTQACMLHVHVA